MIEKDMNIKAIHIYSELNMQINFVVIVSGSEDMEMLTRSIDDACGDWFDLERNPDQQCIPICDFISDMLDMAGIAHWIFGIEQS